jgi:peptide/nickel transport system ATP-binding protein
MSLLELDEVEVSYHRRGREPVRAVAGATLKLEAGEIVGLVGESGCGKSTLARAAAGLVAPTAGSVRFDGRPVIPLSRRARPREHVLLQMVFQDPFSSLNPRRRVSSQLADALVIHELVPAGRRRERVAELLLAAEPTALVLDEPLSSLDASAQAQVANLLQRLSRDLQIAMLLISHDLAIVRQVADRISVMYLGVIVETGPTKPVWGRPLHPYTEALINAVPRADGEGVKPAPLPGEVPDPARPPAGCRFHPRCPYAFDRCRTETPELVEVADGRFAACWLQEPGAPVDLPGAPLAGGADDGASAT